MNNDQVDFLKGRLHAIKQELAETKRENGELRYIIAHRNDRRTEMWCTIIAVGSFSAIVGAVLGYIVGGL